jgi:hypothetical protein
MSLAADRARNGSRRKRDLAALQAERTFPVPANVKETDAATQAWDEVARRLQRELHRSVWAMWIVHCPLLGEHNGSLVIAGHPQRAAWIRRRYAKTLGDFVRAETRYLGVFVCDQ